MSAGNEVSLSERGPLPECSLLSSAHSEESVLESSVESTSDQAADCDGDYDAAGPSLGVRSGIDMAVGDQAVIELLPSKLSQPVLSFPQRLFGKQNRSFCSTWYQRYPWLHYQVASDTVLCFYCHVADKRNIPVSANKDAAFTTTGFSNWKKAIERFNKHEKSASHHQAVDLIERIPKSTANIGNMISTEYAKQKSHNRALLQIIISSIRFLSRQGIALRGRYKSGDDNLVGGEHDSNFIQLLKLRAHDIPQLTQWMEKSQDKFTSPDIQNEILKIMALTIQREIKNEVSGKWYTIMVDETTDISNTEQMVFCLRYVDDCLEVNEEFIGLQSLESTTAEVIISFIKDILLRMDLRIENCRGQCYDGASTMAGHKSGVAKGIMELEPRALYTHCYGHALNLAVQDSIKHVKLMKDTLDTTHEIIKLIKKSPKREAIFKSIATFESPSIRTLCPTRWTVRAEALASISENYEALLSTWEVAKESTKETEMKARILGVESQMEKFEYFFGVEFGRKVFNMVDNLSKTLQLSTISACEAQGVIERTIISLQSIRSTEQFDLFWKYVQGKSSKLNISTPRLPRRKRPPKRYDIGEAIPEYPSTAGDYFRSIYFEVIDLMIATIKNRFEQKGYQMLQKLELILFEKQVDPAIYEEIIQFYGTDINKDRLQAQLIALHTIESITDLQSSLSFLKSLTGTEKEYYSEVLKVAKFILVMPATNAISERSFSALRRTKTWLRSTINQVRLNHCMTLYVHKTRTDSIDLKQIGNEFIAQNSSRLHVFGHFD